MCMDVYVIMNVVYMGRYIDSDIDLSLIFISHDMKIICVMNIKKRIL